MMTRALLRLVSGPGDRLPLAREILLLLLYCAVSCTALTLDAATKTNVLLSTSATPAAPAVTTASMFLPFIGRETWSMVRGSVVAANADANETTYRILCPTHLPIGVELAIDFPTQLTKGPSSLRGDGTFTNTFAANVQCQMGGSTAATCSGYLSLRQECFPSYDGATELSWSSIFSGTDMHWGQLTLVDATATGVSFANVPTEAAAPTVPHSLLQPSATGQNAGARASTDARLVLIFAASTAAFVALGALA